MGKNIYILEPTLVNDYCTIKNPDSIRDPIVCSNAHKSKHYHLGFRKSISKSNLAEANLNWTAEYLKCFYTK